MDPDPDPQKQPVYPQQYPPQHPQQYPPQYYGPPYYPPYPPPKRDDKKVLTIIVIVLVIIFVLPTVMAAVLYFIVIDLAPSGTNVPTGVWGTKTVISATAVNVEFGKVSSEPRPVDLGIILVRNRTTQGSYAFATNYDGNLFFQVGSGFDIADIEYSDLADNERINTGDHLKLTNLHSQSDYTIRMIWRPTGDQITTTTFSTP